ncbi:MerC domain-containing protein [Flavobacteriaceae bacterium]|nr:MerC domain-containing protein [Flavobacteriaceae bacterium]MDA9977719.1 MerC domain-containing protein [Flavobacteriaceae bacterium]MDB4024594.1 MerC domain-containing protein [Flavobacteriaceae bacterium]MDB4131088.1 MerC domain-containing protein [Flavobacteriaceae bacterium]MDC0592865.1 MerC domain-containing protein [Flavobacteriaceae bacterium]
MNVSLRKPDTIGAIVSTLCVVHCLLTPLLFVAQSYTATHSHEAPFWWKNLDYLFILISIIAVYESTKKSTNKLIKAGLWMSWIILFLLILNEKLVWIEFDEIITYAVALTLSMLHIYNLNYCQCKTENCCNNK